MNYPSSKHFADDYVKFENPGLNFIINYIEAYKIANDVDLNAIYEVFNSIIQKLCKIEIENYKKYKHLSKKK